MKTTVDLPDELVREIKIKAIRQGQKLKHAVADLLRKGLDAPGDATAAAEQPEVGIEPVTGLPCVVCRHPAPLAVQLTPERVAGILLEQDESWHYDSGG